MGKCQKHQNLIFDLLDTHALLFVFEHVLLYFPLFAEGQAAHVQGRRPGSAKMGDGGVILHNSAPVNEGTW